MATGQAKILPTRGTNPHAWHRATSVTATYEPRPLESNPSVFLHVCVCCLFFCMHSWFLFFGSDHAKGSGGLGSHSASFRSFRQRRSCSLRCFVRVPLGDSEDVQGLFLREHVCVRQPALHETQVLPSARPLVHDVGRCPSIGGLSWRGRIT